MLGLMQDWPLTVDKILDHAKNWHGEREVVTRSVEGPIVRTTYGDIHRRAKRVSNDEAIFSAIRQAVQFARAGVIEEIEKNIDYMRLPAGAAKTEE